MLDAETWKRFQTFRLIHYTGQLYSLLSCAKTLGECYVVFQIIGQKNMRFYWLVSLVFERGMERRLTGDSHDGCTGIFWDPAANRICFFRYFGRMTMFWSIFSARFYLKRKFYYSFLYRLLWRKELVFFADGREYMTLIGYKGRPQRSGLSPFLYNVLRSFIDLIWIRFFAVCYRL
jgi:hypothetical protein